MYTVPGDIEVESIDGVGIGGYKRRERVRGLGAIGELGGGIRTEYYGLRKFLLSVPSLSHRICGVAIIIRDDFFHACKSII